MIRLFAILLLMAVKPFRAGAQPGDSGRLEFVVTNGCADIHFDRYGAPVNFEIRSRDKKYTMQLYVQDRETGRIHNANFLYTAQPDESLNILEVQRHLRDFTIILNRKSRQMKIEIRNVPPVYSVTRIPRINFTPGAYALDVQTCLETFNPADGPMEIRIKDWSRYKVDKQN